MNKYIVGLPVLLIIGLVALVAGNKGIPGMESGKLRVATSFYPLYFFATEIGGDKVQVTNITPAGAEPHDYEPTGQDMARIESSSVVILNGGELETWGETIKENLEPKETIIVTASEGLATEQAEEGGKTIIDPHMWLSPPLVKQMVDKIAEALITSDIANAAYYASNANALKVKLDELDNTYKAGLATCESKDIITSHAAFTYLASAYGLRQISITGISPDAEPSSQELGKVAAFAKENKIKYIFFESLVSPKLSETIAAEIGAKTLVLNPIEGLSSEEIAKGNDYFTEMRNNLTNLQIALQCTT